jgi:hypothetical protein
VYCYGDLLAAVQTSGIFEDSKEFVDMPMNADPEEILLVGALDEGRMRRMVVMMMMVMLPVGGVAVDAIGAGRLGIASPE